MQLYGLTWKMEKQGSERAGDASEITNFHTEIFDKKNLICSLFPRVKIKCQKDLENNSPKTGYRLHSKSKAI